MIGHVHLKVSDVPRSLAFYRDALGFEEQAQFGAQAAFVSAGGYHHHVGLNSWESRGGAPAPDTAPGLRRVEFALGGADRLAELAGRVGQQADGGGELSMRDPDRQLLVFAAA